MSPYNHIATALTQFRRPVAGAPGHPRSPPISPSGVHSPMPSRGCTRHSPESPRPAPSGWRSSSATTVPRSTRESPASECLKKRRPGWLRRKTHHRCFQQFKGVQNNRNTMGKPWNSNMRIRLEAKLKGFLSFCLVEVILEASTNHQSNDIGVMSWKNS